MLHGRKMIFKNSPNSDMKGYSQPFSYKGAMDKWIYKFVVIEPTSEDYGWKGLMVLMPGFGWQTWRGISISRLEA